MSFVERKGAYLRAVAAAYASQVQKQQQNKNQLTVQQLNVDTTGDSCKKCLNYFITPPDALTGENYKRNRSFIDSIKHSLCYTNCVTNVSDIDMNMVVTIQSNSQIAMSAADTEKIADNVRKTMEDQYGDTLGNTSEFNQKTLTIISNINASSTAIVNQSVTTTQSLNIKGSGAEVNNVNMDVFVDAVMSAIVGNKTNLQIINEITQAQMDEIRKTVQSSFTNVFSSVWADVKWYVIGMGAFVGLLMLLIMFLLVKKAMQ